jgi:hypothetical protein
MRTFGPITLFAILAFTSPASGQGALVVAIPDGGLRENFAFGRAVGGDNPEERAMKICRDEAVARKMPATACRVVEKFKDGCISLAFDSTDRWAGWAVAKTTQDAAQAALKKCAEGGRNCKTHSTACDR